MDHDQSLRELLLLADGPPEGVWQASMDFALTSDNETPDYLVSGINADNTPQTPDADADATQDADDQAYDALTATYEDHEDDIGPSSETLIDRSGLDDLEDTGKDYGG